MRAHELISDSLPVLYVTDSVQTGLEKMEDHKVCHLPLVEKNKYLGILTESHLLDCLNPSQGLGELHPGFQDEFVYDHQHIFDVANILSKHQLTSLAVLDGENNFSGTVLIQDVLFAIGDRKEFEKDDTILNVLTEAKGFSVSDITRIIESNGGKVVLIAVSPLDNDIEHLKVTIKLHDIEISRVLAALERFEYKVIDKYMKNKSDDDNFDRLNHLFKYLDI